MPKVVILNDASVARGGATGLALLQARLLRARGLAVVFASADRGAGAAALRDIGVEVHLAGAQPLTEAAPHVAATRGLYNPAVARMLARVIAAHDGPDTVYHVHSWSKALTPAVFAALRPVAPRVFIHAHDFFLACPNGGFMDYQAMRPCARRGLSAACLTTQCDKRSFAQKLWRSARQAILHRSLPRRAPWGGIVLIHPAMAPRLVAQGYPAERLRVLRNPAEALSPRRIPAETNRGFLFIGRIEAEKGIEELIAAAQAAGVALTVVGEGPLRGPLSRAHPQLRFTGWLDRAGMLAEAQQARAVVMPSRYPEPFGLVAAEAVLSGLPVILSEPALLAPEIAAQGLGWACDTRDPAAFAALLRQVADLPPAALRQVSEAGFGARAGLCLTTDAWCDGLLELYAGVTGSLAAGPG
ncbi:glycosyltransferase [Rhodobacter capsulatus]|uniref:glycosyltransferase n=1 Tax=Rhodobacter capsulatus TaxID=1061 RepID=UPI0003D35572|nr:glycosyltransferase [Rhodobacter capsulatus]ETD90725.1 glycosyl transferase [Rhodobacter capsulatus YW2]